MLGSHLADDPKAAVTMDMPTIDRNDELYIALNVDRVRVLMNIEQLERLRAPSRLDGKATEHSDFF